MRQQREDIEQWKITKLYKIDIIFYYLDEPIRM